MTSDEATLLAGLLAGIVVALEQSTAAAPDAAEWRAFLDRVETLLAAHAGGDLDAADRLYEEIGRYGPMRRAFLAALGPAAGGVNRSVAAEPLRSDPDPLSNILVLYRQYTRSEAARAQPRPGSDRPA
jgi:hypothetical protein